MYEKNWFGGRDECVALLLILLSRQSALKELTMENNDLSSTQKQQIRNVVEQTAPSCKIEFYF